MLRLKEKTTNSASKTPSKPAPKKRYTVLDCLRGLSLVNMVIYHTVWDLVRIFGVRAPWFNSDIAFIWQQSICWTFILLSGFCWDFGRKKIRRGLLLLLCSAIISVITIAFMPQNPIMFGVLNIIGSGMLIMIPIEKHLKNLNPYIFAALSFCLFILTRNTGSGWLGFGDWNILKLPDFLYANTITAYIGFRPAGFVSRDYFPLIPWLFMYLTGYYIHLIFVRKNLLRHLSSFRIKPLEFIGRHTLIIYMVHQPVIYAVLYLIFEIVL